MTAPILIKIGGHELEDEQFLGTLAQVIAALETPVIIVHGGGKEISQLQQQLGIEPQYINGVRVTDAPSLEIVEMVLCGLVNKRLVRHLLAGGVDATGLSGVDRGLVRAVKMPSGDVDMGYTGEVHSVRPEVVQNLLQQGIVPVIAPICLGETSNFNVNADHVAGAIAQAVGAAKVVFLTNVEGVLVEDTLQASLSASAAQDLIADGTIFGGMIPKVQTALAVLEGGVPQVAITNLQGLKTHGGTVFSQTLLNGEG